MLKQILRDMYVDPEILAGLDETYKQTLFCKMREEQIRRWRVWDEKHHNIESNQLIESTKLIEKNNCKNIVNIKNKKVEFLLGEDGEPWVWVMGEHSNDITIEDILEEETIKKARQLAETEFLKNVEATLSDIITDCDENKSKVNNEVEKEKDVILNLDNTSTKKIEDLEIYCSVDELKDMVKAKSLQHQQSPLTGATNNNNNINNNNNENNTMLSNINTINCNDNNKSNNINMKSVKNSKKDDIPETIYRYNKPQPGKVSARIAQWEQRSIGKRTSEIFQQIQQQKQEVAKEAEEAAKKDEALWKEQERKAKEAEVKIREIARRAREEHRKSLSADEPISLDHSLVRPPSQEAVIEWYRNYEKPRKAGMIDNDRPADWFYGLLERTKAENLLMSEEQGTYLVRLSEKIWGYAISYKDFDRCKHYLVNVKNGKYKFLGQNQIHHDSLSELLKYHSNVPITALGMELLQKPCSHLLEDKSLGGLL